MRPSAILSEALRNLRSGTSRAVFLAVAVAILAAGATVADAVMVDSLTRRAETYLASGAAIRTVVSRQQIDIPSCDALDRAQGVPPAGALREEQPLRLAALPGTSFPRFAVSPRFTRVLDLPSEGDSGAFVSRSLAETLGVSAGDTLLTTEGVIRIASIFEWPADGRDKRLGRAVLVPVPVGAMDECWALVWPATTDRDGLLRATAFATPDSKTPPVVLAQVNKSLGSTLDVASEYEERVTRLAPAFAALAAAAVGAVGVRLRRLEIAAALHAGATRSSVYAVLSAETVIWSTAAAAGASGLAAVAHLVGIASVSVATGTLTALLAAAAALPGVLAAASGIRERHLFRYFKDR
ncbi:hypothetical protein O159_21760 [Leifsonia xyli subsp. cynodontis DSM 46306]|uniref:ABC transporter permease n=1 Tax=Leifsonia xyli subsp. cynodontis DSM 46306 TaxID=1389489 RepID=U3PBN4_LEIXC|nr:hypothetical protein [Leifsonia xyli]AGW42152.1 hypothetical protein O159_21760 [Leifsonia xyli subsp. cynodontis DSM 46306]